MSMFKQFGDMAKLVKAAPGLIDQAATLTAQSETYRARMDAQAVHAMTAQPAPGNLARSRGSTSNVYARIVKGIAAFQYDETKLPVVAACRGGPVGVGRGSGRLGSAHPGRPRRRPPVQRDLLGGVRWAS